MSAQLAQSHLLTSIEGDITAAHFAAIVESSVDAIISKTLSGVILSWNAAAERLLGFEALEMIGQPIIGLFPPELLEEEEHILGRIRRGERVESYETVRMTKDGRRLSVELTISPVRNASGRIVAASKIMRDLTERKRIEALREQFVAVLGHDLRNPLAAITAGVTLLRRTPLNERAAGLTDMMQDSAARMAALIDSIMDLARSSLGGGLVLNRASESLEPVLRQVIAELATPMPERDVKTDFVLTKPVDCDRGRIAQLFSNLLANALTYGSVNRPIRVRAVSSTKGFELSVANEGQPISPTDLSRLFQPFYRGAAPTSRQGLGLGLYIAHEVATAHGGKLEVESTPEETRFRFWMPMN